MVSNKNKNKSVFNFLQKPGKMKEIKNFENRINKNPDDDRAHVRLAELYGRMNEENKAIELYMKAAQIFEKKGFINKAKAVLKQALSMNPEHGKVNVLLADHDREAGLYKDAVMRYQAAVNYYNEKGNKAAAIEILRKILEIIPDSPIHTLKLAELLINDRRNEEAQEMLTPVVMQLKNKGHSDNYLFALNLLYKASDGDEEVGRDLVNACLKSGKYQRALTVLQKLIMEDMESLEYHEKLAYVFKKLKKKDKLISTYKQIAILNEKNNNIKERNNIYREILKIDPKDREALIALKEDDTIQKLVSEKIDESSQSFEKEFEEEDDEGDGITIDIDVEEDKAEDKAEDADNREEKPSVEMPELDKETEKTIKEARVFNSYNLHDKALKKIRTLESWNKLPQALEVVVESHIESEKFEAALENIEKLISLHISLGNKKEAGAILEDYRELGGSEEKAEKWLKVLGMNDETAEEETVEQEVVEDAVMEQEPSEEGVAEDGAVEEGEPYEEEIAEEEPDDEESAEEEKEEDAEEIGVEGVSEGEIVGEEANEEEAQEDNSEKVAAEEESIEKDTKDDTEDDVFDAIDNEIDMMESPEDKKDTEKSLEQDDDEKKEPDQKELDELEFFISIEDYESAVMLLQELVATYPDSEFLGEYKEILPEQSEDLGSTLKEVRDTLSKSFEDGEHSAEEFYDMGMAHMQMGMLSEAISYLRKAIQMDRENINYRTLLAEVFIKTNRPGKAAEVIEKTISLAKDDETVVDLLEKLADLYYDTGNEKSRKKTLEKLKSLKES